MFVQREGRPKSEGDRGDNLIRWSTEEDESDSKVKMMIAWDTT